MEKCEGCGHLNLASLRRVFWTQDPRLVALERWVKGLLVLACGTLGMFVVLVPSFRGTAMGTGAGWVMALPIGLGVATWLTASKITRHVSHFRAGLFWSVTFALSASILPVLWYPTHLPTEFPALMVTVQVLLVMTSLGSLWCARVWTRRKASGALLVG